MGWILLSIAAYVAFVAFNAWALWGWETKNGKVPSRADFIFVAVVSLCGPLGIGAACSALADGRIEKWASKPMFPTRPTTEGKDNE